MIRKIEDELKKLGQSHVYHSVASHLLLTTVSKHLGTEDTGFWTSGRKELSMLVWYRILAALQSWVFFVMFAFHDVPPPNTIRQAGFFNSVPITSWMVPVLFSSQDAAFMTSENSFKFRSSTDYRTVFHFASSSFKMSFGPEKLQDHRPIWPAFVDCSERCNKLRFLEVLRRPCSDFHDRIMSVFNAVQSEGQEITNIQYWYSAVPDMHRDASRFSESLDDIIYCRWWNIQSHRNFTLRNIIFILLHNLLTILGQVTEPLPIFTSERLSL